MAKRLTAEQKAEQAEQARQERIAQQVAAFREKIEKERAKRVYSNKALAFEELHTEGNKSAWALYELVGDFERIERQLRNYIDRAQERLTDATKRMDAGERASWYSTMLGDLPADIEQHYAKLTTLADAVTRLAWATGWYVPQVLPQREVERRDKMLSLRVVESALDLKAWRVFVGDDALTMKQTGYGDDDTPVTYLSEQDA